jgi:hypothetical protein
MADKPDIKDLSSTILPLLRSLGAAKKLFLTPLPRAGCQHPCCAADGQVAKHCTTSLTLSPLTEQQCGCPKGLHQECAVYQVHSECQGALPQQYAGD